MVSGACFAIGREAFVELGGFDERFFLYFEDADLCRRALGAGMTISYVPNAVVPHIWGASSSEDYHFGPAHARSMRQYLTKWYGHPGGALAILIAWLRLIGFAVTARPATGRSFRAFLATLNRSGPR
jgi:GT2 family glycosyltransferase